MKGRRVPFILLVGLSVAVALGLFALPGSTAASWAASASSSSSLPLTLEVLWVAWFFALWGTLVAFMIVVGGWTAEQLRASEERVTAAQLERIAAVPVERFRPDQTATDPNAADRNIDWGGALKHWGSPIVTRESPLQVSPLKGELTR